MAKTFKTSITGIGPFCIEFEDGEIISTRSLRRQKMIANMDTILKEMKSMIGFLEGGPYNYDRAQKLIRKIEESS